MHNLWKETVKIILSAERGLRIAEIVAIPIALADTAQ